LLIFSLAFIFDKLAKYKPIKEYENQHQYQQAKPRIASSSLPFPLFCMLIEHQHDKETFKSLSREQ